jgi:hypothetical protein
MATIAALTEDLTGATVGSTITTGNTSFTDVTGTGTSTIITDPFDGTRRMMEVTVTAQQKIHETNFTPTTLLWHRFDYDTETPLDANTEIFNA